MMKGMDDALIIQRFQTRPVREGRIKDVMTRKGKKLKRRKK
jgi:hypothetical protein